MAKKKKTVAKKKTKKVKKMKYSDAPAVVFADVKAIIENVANNSEVPVSSSPHGRFWNTDRNSFVNQYVNPIAPLTSQFYVFLDNQIMPPAPGPYMTQDDLDIIKMWLSTGFS